MSDSSEELVPVSRLAHGISVYGAVECDDILHIDGIVEGKLLCRQALHIDKRAQIRANISAPMVEIYGEVHGDLAVDDLVIIHPTGSVEGDIICPRLIIADGGKLTGYADTRGQREEVIDAILSELGGDDFDLTLEGMPKWGGAKGFAP